MPAPKLTLYSRPGCHLCDEMKDAAAPVAAEYGTVIDVVDIDQDPALQQEYGYEIPVLLVNGRKAFKFRLTARELRRRLSREP